ncbi:MAG: putative molybdenum carrier protein, partial [Aureliella sp.]
MNNRLGLTKIVSGGQTGVDRGALDAAIACNIPHGGWCPKDRLAEDGRIAECYQLTEHES